MAKIRVTKFLKKLSVIVMFCGVSASHATAIDTHRSINVKTFHVDEKIVRKVIPVIRVLIAKQGHLASVSGTNKLVVAAKPETLAVLEDIFANLDVEKFDPKQLRNEAKKRLKKGLKRVPLTTSIPNGNCPNSADRGNTPPTPLLSHFVRVSKNSLARLAFVTGAAEQL